MEPIVLGIAVVALLVAFRHFAARRVLARQGQFVWLMFLPMLIGAVVVLWAGIQALPTVPIGGAVMTVAGGLYLGLVLRFITRLSHSVSSTGPQDDIFTAITEPVVDYLTTLMALILVGGLVAVVVLIVWGINQTAR
jgi:hypothetical protein